MGSDLNKQDINKRTGIPLKVFHATIANLSASDAYNQQNCICMNNLS